MTWNCHGNLMSIWTKLPLICDMKWYRISMRILVTFFTGYCKIKYGRFVKTEKCNQISGPCKKCDVNFHGNSMSFLVKLTTVWSKLTSNSHDNSMSFIQVLFVFHAGTWHGFWTSSSHGISMAFSKKMMGFPSDLVSFPNQTKLPSKRHETIPVKFLTGLLLLLLNEMIK